MTGTNILILATSFLALLVVGRFNGPKDWVQALYKHPAVSLLLIIAFASTFLGGSRQPGTMLGENIMIDSTRTIRIVVVILLFCISMLSILKKPKAISLAGPGAILMLSYGLLAIMSATYSPIPMLTVWKGFEVVTVVLAVISISSQIRTIEDLEWIINLLLAILLYLAITILAGAIIDPDNAFRNLWEEGNVQDPLGKSTSIVPILRGIIPELSPAASGGIAGFTAIAAFIRLLEKNKQSRLGYMIVAGLSLTVIILVHSRTGVIALAVAVVAILILKRYTLYALLTGIPLALIVLFTSLSDTLMNYMYRGQTEEQFKSMSGRTEFWPVVIDKFLESPLTGYGYYASQRAIFGLSGVDNTYISVALGLGIIGLAIFLSALFMGMKAIIRNWPSKNSSNMYKRLWLLIVGLSIITFIRSLTGITFDTFYYMLVVYMILHIALYSQYRIKKERIISDDNINNKEPKHNLNFSASPRILSRSNNK